MRREVGCHRGKLRFRDNRRSYYPGSKEGHIPTRSASEGSGAFPSLARRVNITLAPKKHILTRRASEGTASEPSLARRVSMCKDAKLSCRGNMQQHAELPCRGNIAPLRRQTDMTTTRTEGRSLTPFCNHQTMLETPKHASYVQRGAMMTFGERIRGRSKGVTANSWRKLREIGNQPVDGLNWGGCLESSMTHRPTPRRFTGTPPTRALRLGDAP